MKEKPKCLLCKLGYKVPAVQTEVIPAMEVDGEPVYLCEYHDRLLHSWAPDEERKNMLRIMSPHIYGGLRGRSRRKEVGDE